MTSDETPGGRNNLFLPAESGERRAVGIERPPLSVLSFFSLFHAAYRPPLLPVPSLFSAIRSFPL